MVHCSLLLENNASKNDHNMDAHNYGYITEVVERLLSLIKKNS